jgi:ligand-binding SRPBCC domain-containing protein
MKKSFGFTVRSSFSSRSGVTSASLWNHITSMRNVNKELMPFLYMTYPKEAAVFDKSKIVFREFLFMSVILLLGIIPIDLHWLRLDSLEDGYGFHENSVTLLHFFWKHHRYIEENADSSRIDLVDEIEFHPRLPFLGFVILSIVKFVFNHRHRQLKRIFSIPS